MFQIIQEAALPKLSQTSLYSKFDEKSGITDNIKAEIKSSADNVVPPEDIPEIISLMKLNGDSIVKKSIESYKAGNIVIIFNKTTSKIPSTLPFVIINQQGMTKAFVFADKVIDNINSPNEYTKLMAVLEAAYLALMLNKKPDTFIMNRNLMLTLCNVYTLMTATPLEQKLYMKGDNLVKALLYIIAYFYKIIDGDTLSVDSIPYKRIISDKVDPLLAKQIVDEVKNNEDTTFMGLLEMITKINPLRYKDLKSMYLSYFTQACGISLIFALENISYLFILITSACYKTTITAYGLNKTVVMPVKKSITLLTSMNL